jgi:IMP dehydrogenase
METESPRLVADVMTTPLETSSADETVADAAARMHERDISALFVPGNPAGIVTTTDVTGVVADGRDPEEVLVGEVMTAPVESAMTTVELTEAAAMMANYGIKHLPVIDGHRDYVGMVSSSDLVFELA